TPPDRVACQCSCRQLPMRICTTHRSTCMRITTAPQAQPTATYFRCCIHTRLSKATSWPLCLEKRSVCCACFRMAGLLYSALTTAKLAPFPQFASMPVLA
ncbi:hypothetical protein H4R23_006421, partial [Coemansia sp. Cherry 401B]